MPLSPEAMVHSTQSLNGLLAVGEGSDAVLAQKCKEGTGPQSSEVCPPPRQKEALGKVLGAYLLGWLCERSHTFLITDRPRLDFMDKASEISK